MDAEVAQRLIALNHGFYQSFAEAFSETRGRLQPGVLRVLENVPPESKILDLGCGNGEVAAELARRGHQGRYVGLDFSEELLAFARRRGGGGGLKATFVRADLTSSDWAGDAVFKGEAFDFVFAFAALHHIPSRELRLQFLVQVHELLAPDGRFIHSNWQFLNSTRLKERIQLWEAAGLSEKDVDEGDYLLDWRREGSGLRYVHHFNEKELARLAKATGFEVVEIFNSDGETGNLGLYQVWALSEAR